MVQDVGDIMSPNILHLQDLVEVLQPLVIVGHVGGQVAVDDADIIAVKLQADVDTPFVSLVGQVGRRVGRCSGWDTPLFSHRRPERRWSDLPQDLPGPDTQLPRVTSPSTEASSLSLRFQDAKQCLRQGSRYTGH